jgi:hypothetical protein
MIINATDPELELFVILKFFARARSWQDILPFLGVQDYPEKWGD